MWSKIHEVVALSPATRSISPRAMNGDGGKRPPSSPGF
jgi:hypothetical protein